MNGQWCYFRNWFSSVDCEKIIAELKDSNLQNPNIGFDYASQDPSYRRGKICWLDEKKYEYVFDEIWKVARIANERWFDFHLTGLECVQFSKYQDDGRGFYKKHQDVFWLNSTPHHRKLTCVLQLSNPDSYTGGDLILHDCDQYPDVNDLRQQGNLIFFPSFLYHEIMPVLSGERYSLVSWIYGPKWK